METLHLYGNPEQKKKWLAPLLDGTIRSAFCMTEPAVASSDAANISCTAVRDGDEYVINGRKWWSSGLGHPRCDLLIVMVKTDPTNSNRHRQQSMILVPTNTPGVEKIRALTVFGHDDAPHGHLEVAFTNVRVPVTNVLRGEGEGFAIAQGRLGPGRIHHCMRAIGMGERALELMVQRAVSREAFGRRLAQHGMVQEQIALSRMELDQARLLVLHCAHLIDTVGTKGAFQQIAMIKVVAPRVACAVIDRAIQVHGAAGVSQDTVLTRLYAGQRTLRIADGPDEVHLVTVARVEVARAAKKLNTISKL
jgi:alkylation response protein AidB-like acyl-CoA dehydrogenase